MILKDIQLFVILNVRTFDGFESVRKRSRGFAIGLIMIGAVVAIGAMVSLVVQFSDLLSDSIIYLTTEIPRFDYRVVDGQETGNAAFAKYSQLRNVWGGLMGLGIGMAAISLVFEKASFLNSGTGYRIFTKTLIMLFFFTFFPYVWDIAATSVEGVSHWIISPGGPEYLYEHTEYILSKVSGISYECIDSVKPDHFAGLNSPWDTIINTLSDDTQADLEFSNDLSWEDKCPVESSHHPDNQSISDTLTDVFLSFFRGAFVLMIIVSMIMIGTGRIVLTGVFMIIIPITEMLGLVPFFTKLSDKIRDMLVALLLLPMFTALAIAGGSTYLADFTCESPYSSPDCKPPSALHSWFVSITVLALVAFMPTIIVPQLNTFSRSLTNMGGFAVQTGTSAMVNIGGFAVQRGMMAYKNMGKRGGDYTTRERSRGSARFG